MNVEKAVALPVSSHSDRDSLSVLGPAFSQMNLIFLSAVTTRQVPLKVAKTFFTVQKIGARGWVMREREGGRFSVCWISLELCGSVYNFTEDV